MIEQLPTLRCIYCRRPLTNPERTATVGKVMFAPTGAWHVICGGNSPEGRTGVGPPVEGPAEYSGPVTPKGPDNPRVSVKAVPPRPDLQCPEPRCSGVLRYVHGWARGDVYLGCPNCGEIIDLPSQPLGNLLQAALDAMPLPELIYQSDEWGWCGVYDPMFLTDADAMELELPMDAWPGFETVKGGVTYVAVDASRDPDRTIIKWFSPERQGQ